MLIHAVDKVSSESIEIRARAVLNTAGPWAESLINRESSDGKIPSGTYSRDLCFVVPGQLHSRFGLAVQGRTSDPDAVLSRPNRHLFLIPWRNVTLVGVWHKVYTFGPDNLLIEEQETQPFIDEINEAYPALNLDLADVTMWNTGLVPFGEEQSSETDLSYGKRSRFIDHGKNGGPQGLYTLIGVRYTMGRGESALAMKAICKFLQRDSSNPATDPIPTPRRLAL